jgi:uncharacterized protein
LSEAASYRDFPGIFPKAAMESPCLKICVYEPGAGICLGCGRTLQEIAGWTSFGEEERRRIMEALPARLGALKRPAS